MRESSLSHPGFVLSNKICSGTAALACSIDSHQPRTQAVQSAQNLNLVQSGKHTTTQFKHSLSAGSAHHHSLKTVNSHSIHSHGLNNPAIVRNSHSLTYMPLSKHSAPRTPQAKHLSGQSHAVAAATAAAPIGNLPQTTCLLKPHIVPAVAVTLCPPQKCATCQLAASTACHCHCSAWLRSHIGLQHPPTGLHTDPVQSSAGHRLCQPWGQAHEQATGAVLSHQLPASACKGCCGAQGPTSCCLDTTTSLLRVGNGKDGGQICVLLLCSGQGSQAFRSGVLHA